MRAKGSKDNKIHQTVTLFIEEEEEKNSVNLSSINHLSIPVIYASMYLTSISIYYLAADGHMIDHSPLEL